MGPDSSTGFVEYPRLTDAPTWAGSRRPGLAAEEYLEQSMRQPSAFISPAFTAGPSPGGASPMPQLQLSDAEIDALVDYLLGR
jgi:hypothetical protein